MATGSRSSWETNVDGQPPSRGADDRSRFLVLRDMGLREPAIGVDNRDANRHAVLVQSPVPEFVALSGRRFAGFPAAVLVFIVNPVTRRLLLFESPAKRGREGWEVVCGAVEHGETLVQAVHREVAEEAGIDVRVNVVGTVHTWNWRYDERVTNMISTAFVASYLGGEVIPGDDLVGCGFRWVAVDEARQLASAGHALIPEDIGLFDRALQCFDLWAGPERHTAERSDIDATTIP